MNSLRKFVSTVSELLQKYKPLDIVRNLTKQIPSVTRNVTPYQQFVTTIKKGYDRLQKSIKPTSQNTETLQTVHIQSEQDNQVKVLEDGQSSKQESVKIYNFKKRNQDTPAQFENYEQLEPAKQFKNIAYVYLIKSYFFNEYHPEESDGILRFMVDYKHKVNKLINVILDKELDKLKGVKYNIVLEASFRKPGSDEFVIAHFWSSKITNATVILNKSEIEQSIMENFNNLQERIDEYISNGSGWQLHSINQLEVNIVKYTPLKGSSYIELPYAIKCKKACVNVKNNDEQCFAYAVLSAIYPVDRNHNPNDVKHYRPHLSELNMEGIEYPVSLDNIKKFEKQNPKYGINVNILEKNNEVVPRVICKDKNKVIINLLLISDGEKQHYVWIKNFTRLMSAKVSKDGHELYWCYNCLSHFTSEKVLHSHQDNGCYDNPCAKIVLPEPNTEDCYISYKETMMKKQLKVPFIIYADFEALLKEMISNKQYQQHDACSYGYKLVSVYEGLSKEYKSYRGPNTISEFLESLVDEEQYIQTILVV